MIFSFFRTVYDVRAAVVLGCSTCRYSFISFYSLSPTIHVPLSYIPHISYISRAMFLTPSLLRLPGLDVVPGTHTRTVRVLLRAYSIHVPDSTNEHKANLHILLG